MFTAEVVQQFNWHNQELFLKLPDIAWSHFCHNLSYFVIYGLINIILDLNIKQEGFRNSLKSDLHMSKSVRSAVLKSWCIKKQFNLSLNRWTVSEVKHLQKCSLSLFSVKGPLGSLSKVSWLNPCTPLLTNSKLDFQTTWSNSFNVC